MPSQKNGYVGWLRLIKIISLRKFERYVKRIAGALALFFLSAMLMSLGAVGMIFSIFFALADMSSLVMPALITGGISWLLAILAVIEGILLFRPRRYPRRV